MRHFFSSFCRLIACLLVMTVLTSRIAMAAYACPQLVQAPMQEMMEGMPCAGMDAEKPVQCSEYQAGEKPTLKHLAGAPDLPPVTISFVMPAPAPVVPADLVSSWPDAHVETGADPPFLRTRRLRI
ncbi:hypothetical protein D3870_04670 [Noviherbaspirillum cavernae]|uniref:Uncharacterized protein n=1 Tax=Noviherbaspirillum cavernae TaxID=2320862 RepID=A0A418WYS1_9BURK|nr:hypothetical protein [Noviherbaspirillum cavernae]RJG05409.1 hypothetical protein D3870_04670 [Noviherbaspirillum cavernae]